jgi:hypothetical protein
VGVISAHFFFLGHIKEMLLWSLKTAILVGMVGMVVNVQVRKYEKMFKNLCSDG